MYLGRFLGQQFTRGIGRQLRAGRAVRIHVAKPPEFRDTRKTVKARFWLWPEPFFMQTSLKPFKVFLVAVGVKDAP